MNQLPRHLFANPPQPQKECMLRCRENQSWMIPSAVFVAAVALHKKFLLSSKLWRNPGNMAKTYTHISSTSGKCMAGFLVKSFGGCFRSMVLMAAYYWTSSNCTLSEKIVSVWRR